ncbi:hypothetical protein QYR02_12465 [Microbacterium maritypicum]|uniref:hypothetical protein n=1 Tax=Microbacterium maritypicum TaxID=33918 RepID=UPI002671E346|nr:hypothetical protein [Microbacterium liquefaciens]WKT88258.1 hypothetical protein QYR02_12465 [Microbacterium liquefaciens]
MTSVDIDYYRAFDDNDECGITEREILGRGRNIQQFDDSMVALVETRVRQSGILEQLERWAAEDSKGEGMGGRPAMISYRALLTALLLLAHEGAPMHMTRAALVLQHRLPPKSRELLDLPEVPAAFAQHIPTTRRWFTNTIRAFGRLKNLMDPYPQELYTAKTYTQILEILQNHDEKRAAKYKARLDEYTRLFIRMTFMAQPRSVRRATKKLDVSFDQTYIGTPTTKGYSRKNLASKAKAERDANFGELSPGPVDAFAGFHVKSGKGERVDNQKGDVDQTAPGRGEWADYDWGWVANLAVRVDSEQPGSKRFPSLVVAASLSIPNMEVAEEAALLLESAATLGLAPGIADADKQYWANAKPFRLLQPALKTGFTPSTDYRSDRVGVKGGQHGALFVEGDPYCPGTPSPLLNATPDRLGDVIDVRTYRARIEERKAFQLHVKEKAKVAGGKVILRCPALGPSPTVTCPLREMMVSAAKKARPEVEPETLEEEFLDTICKKHSAAFDLTEMRAPQQAFDYGTEEWETFHDHARNTVESENQQLKASGDEDIATAGRRRVRGITAAQILVTLLIVNHNLRKIAAFLSDQEIERARTTPRIQILRRRDRVWANRYTKTTGDGDLSIPRRRRTSSSTTTPPDQRDQLALTPMRT